MNEKNPLPVKVVRKTLDNGMQVILLHKPGFVRSLFMIGIPAGGGNLAEIKQGKQVQHPSGCAHYLEHQMFRLNGEDVTSVLSEHRTQCNAWTSLDSTCYFVWTSASPREPLEILIDFVQTLDITPETVEKERSIILAEQQDERQDPDRQGVLEIYRSLYHHYPARNEIVGETEDIRSMTEQDLRSFYDAWYDPSRLILTGITGEDPHKVMHWIEQKQKEYPARSRDKLTPVTTAEPDTVHRKHFQKQMDVQIPLVFLGIKLKTEPDPQKAIVKTAALNYWMSSLLSPMNQDFQTWLDSQLFSDLSWEAEITPDHAAIVIEGQAQDPQAFLDEMRRVLKSRMPVSPQTFESLQISSKASYLRTLEDYDSLSEEVTCAALKGQDFFENSRAVQDLTLKQVNDFVMQLDLQEDCDVMILPQDKNES